MAGQRFCQQCGAPIGPGMQFCTKCGARIGGDVTAPGSVQMPSGMPADASETGAPMGAVAGQPYPQQEAVPGTPSPKRSAVPVIVCIVVLVLVAGAGAFALTDGFTNLPWSSAPKSTVTRIDAGSSDEGDGDGGKKEATKQKPKSEVQVAPQKSAEELDQDAAVAFAKTFWTNAEPSGENGADCTTIGDWTDRNLALVDPSCALYGEIQSKGMDMLQAEDSCVSASVASQQGDTVTVTVGVAGHRENPSAGWEKTANFTYRMDIQLNDNDKVTGFTSYYTDPSSGKTYSQSH